MNLRKTFFILPNLFTLSSVFCGFFAITLCSGPHSIDALYQAATAFRHYRLPELYAGYARSAAEARPVSYPVACSPQAWAAGAIPHALWNLLGLRAPGQPGGSPRPPPSRTARSQSSRAAKSSTELIRRSQ